MKFYEFTYAEKTKNHTKIRDNKIIINGKAERVNKVSQLYKIKTTYGQ